MLISIELAEAPGDRIAGLVVTDASETPFDGWLELLGALELVVTTAKPE